MLFSVHENPDPQCSDIRDHDHHLDLSSFSSSSSSSSSTFSIRDYVFSSRSKKDIKTSWPFSLKNLKRCLKHGVKDVLPPFQSVDAIRNQVDDLNPQITIANVDEEEKPVKLDEKVARSGVASTTSNTLFPSTITSVSQSEPARPSQYHRQPRGPGNKAKCKATVNSSSPEDIASNSTTQISEAMASKVCPVCKTFSSSSNTTLNAHIDQCLSAESSTPKWTLDSSKLGPRHRVKPRKTRLMVDIYVTAFPCTLEDLDRRNGSNWALGGPSNFASPDTEESDDKCEEKEKEKEKDDADVDVGAVYIDSNGIKVRILSKPDDTANEPRVSKLADHLRPRKPFKGTKFLSARKKKRRASKLSHYLQLAQTKKLRARSSSQVCGGRENRQIAEASYDVHKPDNKTGNSETLRHWARSKRSGLAKKLDNNPNSVAETRRDMSASSPENNNSSGPENIFYEAQERLVAEKDEAWSSLVERSLTPMKRRLRKERTPRMLKSASFPTPVTDPVDTYDSQLSTSVELHRSKSTRVSSVRKYASSCAVTEPKSDVCLRRNEDRVLPWDEIIAERKEAFPFNHHSRRDNYHSRVDPINVSRFSTKVAVDHHETLSSSHKPVDSEMPSFADGQDQEMFYGVRLGNIVMEDLNASFPDVDPIPIPGPPGSFLPSPRDMSSEDFQGNNNSSLTTSRVHSSQDHRDGDSTDSPVSATSTVSDYNDDVAAPEARNNKERLFETDEPCCCQRKDRVIFHDRMAALNPQDSQLLQRRVIMGSANLLDNLNTETSSERLVVAPARIDSMSPSNPVLRLMGKNLMVGNRDQDTPAFQPPFARQHVDQRSAAPFYSEPPIAPAGNGWARVDPSSHQSGQPYSHLYKCQNNSLL